MSTAERSEPLVKDPVTNGEVNSDEMGSYCRVVKAKKLGITPV